MKDGSNAKRPSRVSGVPFRHGLPCLWRKSTFAFIVILLSVLLIYEIFNQSTPLLIRSLGNSIDPSTAVLVSESSYNSNIEGKSVSGTIGESSAVQPVECSETDHNIVSDHGHVSGTVVQSGSLQLANGSKNEDKIVNSRENAPITIVKAAPIQLANGSKPERKIVNPHDFGYTHNVPNACTNRDIELVILVPGRTSSFDARQAIRETWGNLENKALDRTVVLFLLGATQNLTVQAGIDAEAAKYDDVIQEDFIDSYRNLSMKTVALMKWVTMFCPNSTFVLKVDDDMYINVPYLIKKLQWYLSKHGKVFILGHVHDKVKPIRDENNKYRLTTEEFAPTYFPRYVSGTSYALTTDAAAKLYKESLYVPSFVFEDVYITGMVASKAGVPRIHEGEFTKFVWNGCQLRKKIGSGHANTPDGIRKIHKDFVDPKIKC